MNNMNLRKNAGSLSGAYLVENNAAKQYHTTRRDPFDASATSE